MLFNDPDIITQDEARQLLRGRGKRLSYGNFKALKEQGLITPLEFPGHKWSYYRRSQVESLLQNLSNTKESPDAAQ